LHHLLMLYIHPDYGTQMLFFARFLMESLSRWSVSRLWQIG